MRDGEGKAIRSTLTDLFGRPFGEHIADEAFSSIALRIFAYQYTRNAPYAAYCDRRGVTPDNVDHWTRIPAVPTAAFREVALVAGDAAQVDAVFRTSGTTHGPERRGAHYVPDTTLYHLSLIPTFAACVLPDGAELPMLSLMPTAAELPDSSLAHMITVVLERLGGQGSGCYATARAGIDHDRLAADLDVAVHDGVPVCLLGTSSAFVHWLDLLEARGQRLALPPGSRLMDTGGYKGRGRAVEEDRLRMLYHDLLGIPDAYCVNEYGMTEMCSQFYDAALRDTLSNQARNEARNGARNERSESRAAQTARPKVGPPWVRTRVVDPETLAPLPEGTPGLLQHFDLANAGSVCAIQTEDMGVLEDGGFRLLGRAAGATPRGCSIAMDMLLEAVHARRA